MKQSRYERGRGWTTKGRGGEGGGQGNFSEETGRVTMSARARCRRSPELSVMPSPSSYRHAAGPAIIPPGSFSDPR